VPERVKVLVREKLKGKIYFPKIWKKEKIKTRKREREKQISKLKISSFPKRLIKRRKKIVKKIRVKKEEEKERGMPKKLWILDLENKSEKKEESKSKIKIILKGWEKNFIFPSLKV